MTAPLIALPVERAGRQAVVLDCGANIGLFALYCVGKAQAAAAAVAATGSVGKEAAVGCHVLAVEPMPAAHSLLLRNVRQYTTAPTTAAASPCAMVTVAPRCGVGAQVAAAEAFEYTLDRPGESYRLTHAAGACTDNPTCAHSLCR